MESQKKLMEGIIYMFRYQKKFKTEVEDAIEEYKNAHTLWGSVNGYICCKFRYLSHVWQ